MIIRKMHTLIYSVTMAFTIFSFLILSQFFFTSSDTPSRFTHSQLATRSTAMYESKEVSLIPSKYAQISRSQFSYSFQVDPGQKLIRLRFKPTPHHGFSKYKDRFNVQAGPFTLLANFSTSLTADSLHVEHLVKEFYMYVDEKQALKLIFSPTPSSLHDTYAFVSGVEIIDMHASLYYTHLGAQLIGHKCRVFIDNNTALEKVHIRESFNSRANTKSNGIKDFVWKIAVDVGFAYIVRLHLSELQTSGDVDFSVLIDGKMGDTKQDSDHWYKDYLVMIDGHDQGNSMRDLVVALRNGANGVPLAGFEVLKLSNLMNSLASSNPSPPSFGRRQTFIWPLLFHHGKAIASGLAVVIITLANMVHNKRKQPILIEVSCRRFSFAEIQSATNNFSSEPIGRGGFGKVYKGIIDNGQRTVAVKKLGQNSRQGAREFWNEVKALSELQHVNLVPLIGYCNEGARKMILVYEFMPLGTLGHNLYEESENSLSWEQRLGICIGVGRGLDYLHTGTKHGVIHRDVKSSNILLDAEFKAKISDFGIAKIVETPESHVITEAKGTHGYMDPAYCATRQLTEKSDVYSLGVVLFEVLSGKKAVSPTGQENQLDLISWVRGHICDGRNDRIVDPRVRDEISPNCLRAFVSISEKCLHDDPKKRPTMVQVVAKLEYLLQIHVGGEDDAEMGQNPVDRGREPNTREISSSDKPFWLVLREQFLLRSKGLNIGDETHNCIPVSFISKLTNNFSKKRIIIYDKLYTIYKASLMPNSLVDDVAIARVKCREEEMRDICTELKILSQLDDPRLAPVIAYCYEKGEIFTIYQYSGHGCLLDHLTENNSNLTWIMRLNICIDAARSLRYLHTGNGIPILHGDVSPTTIFLDVNWRAKLVNFGTVLCPLNIRNEHELVYLPPDFSTDKLSEKTDVYSFGLLLLVVLCGAKAYLNYRVGRYALCLPDIVRQDIRNKSLNQIIDREIYWQASRICLIEYLKVALSCLEYEQVDRPSMAKVAHRLEHALRLQEKAGAGLRNESFSMQYVCQELLPFTTCIMKDN